MDLNEATLAILMERLEELEDRVRVLEVGLDIEASTSYDYDEYDFVDDEDIPLD